MKKEMLEMRDVQDWRDLDVGTLFYITNKNSDFLETLRVSSTIDLESLRDPFLTPGYCIPYAYLFFLGVLYMHVQDLEAAYFLYGTQIVYNSFYFGQTKPEKIQILSKQKFT